MKRRFSADEAKAVVRELLPHLEPACAKDGEGKPWLRVAGSLRRRKEEVGDIEFVYSPGFGPVKDGLFTREGDLTEAALESLLRGRIIEPRLNAQGGMAWGKQNKLAVHVASGIPLDFFSIQVPRFWNYLVCRTGSKEHNIRLSQSAQERGLAWAPYHGGFTVDDLEKACAATGRDDLSPGGLILARSEQDVFALAGLPYLEPWER
jgi:DNA polymerase/3'-5' exonuclease PolX